MITMKTELHVSGLKAMNMYDFMLGCDDDKYRTWWPGTHLSFHTVTARPGHVGSVVYMDEYIGKRRLKMSAVVETIDEGRKIVWRMKKLVKLPVRLSLAMADADGGTDIVHEITAGFSGIGSILDPLFRLYMTEGFEKAMDEHARAEFPMLKEVIKGA